MRRLAGLLRRTLTFWLPSSIRYGRTARKIRDSGLFDTTFYLDCYPDVAEGSLDPVQHYVRYGAAEGRNPHPLFDTLHYSDQCPDVVDAGFNPLSHFVTHGWLEGRNPSPACDLASHLARHPSLRESGAEPLAQLLTNAAAWQPPPAPQAEPGPSIPTISLHRIRRQRAVDSSRDRERAEGQSAAASDPVVVIVAHVCPCPPRQGNEYRIQRILHWLESRGYQTVFVCCPLPGEELDERDLLRAANELSNFIYCDRTGPVRVSLVAHLDAIVAGIDKAQVLPLSEEEAQRCKPETTLSAGLAESEVTFCPDLLLRVLLHIDARLPESTAYIPNYVLSTRYLPLLKPSRLKILDTHDVFCTKAAKVAAFGVENNLAISNLEERALLLRADIVMAIQPVEAQELADLVPERRVIEVGVDFDTAPDEAASLPPASTPDRVLMVASSNPMNVKGLVDFINYVWPFVIRERPSAELIVGGAVSEFVPEESPNVIPLGYVDSLDGLYRDCRIVVNPTVAGTGLKIKTLECLAHWRPLVTWPNGVEGLSGELRQLCSVVSDLYEFYLVIAKALSESPREGFTEDERRTIRYSLSGLVVYRELEEVLGDLVASRIPEGPNQGRASA
jgi:hypothetical protein